MVHRGTANLPNTASISGARDLGMTLCLQERSAQEEMRLVL